MISSMIIFVGVVFLLILTVNWSQYDTGVVIGDDVGVAILGFVDFQVRVLPGELLSWIDGLQKRRRGTTQGNAVIQYH